MKPEKDSCLVEVLDRLLDRGVMLNADLIISVSGVPLIGLNLRAALASMETMLHYGLMESWDRDTRQYYASKDNRLPLQEGEVLLLKTFGYIWNDCEIIDNWTPGNWILTSRRLFLWRRSPGEAIFEVPLQDIYLLKMEEAPQRDRSELDLIYGGGKARIYVSDLDEFRSALLSALKETRLVEA
jgi:hypothetical protein